MSACALLAISLWAPASLRAERDSDVAIRVGDEVVTVAALGERVREVVAESGVETVTDSLLDGVVEGLVDKIALSVEARANVRGDTTGLAAKLGDVRRERLAELYREAVVGDIEVTESEADRVFSWLGEELRVRHILSPTERAARAVLVELEKGRDFEALVASHSRDAWTKATGGVLPWFTYGKIDALDEAAYPLSVGEVSGPVRSGRGWHVIRLEDRRPRERTPKDFGSTDFAAAIEARRREESWEAHVDDLWAELDAQWVEEGLDRARAIHRRHIFRSDSLTRALGARQAEGEDVTAELDAPRIATIPASAADQPIVAGEGLAYTIADARPALSIHDGVLRPRRVDVDSYRHWIEPFARRWVATEYAIREGFDERPEIRADLRETVDRHLVERLYEHEIVRGVAPTEEEIRAYFDANADDFWWRPDLDLSVFRTDDVVVARGVKELLDSGVAFSLVRDRFATRDTTLEAFQTGFKRSFPRTPHLAEVAREMGDRQGAVSDVVTPGGKAMVIRIEGVGERTPMTFADAYQMARQNCITNMRERKLRGMLDSLRTELGVEIDEAAMRRAGAIGGGT